MRSKCTSSSETSHVSRPHWPTPYPRNISDKTVGEPNRNTTKLVTDTSKTLISDPQTPSTMESGIPNLLIRTVADPPDSPFSPKDPSTDHDHSSALSFRKGSNGGGGSPLSLSPKSLHLEVKERKETSPRGIRSRSGSFKGWDDVGKGEVEGGGQMERSRVLSLGNWTDVVGKGEGDEDLGQVFEMDGGEQGWSGFKEVVVAPLGVSQG